MTMKESTDDSSAVPGPLEARLLDAEARAKALTEEIRGLYRESRAALPEDKATDDHTAEILAEQYEVDAARPLATPWNLHRIEGPEGRPIRPNPRFSGRFVSVRPCGQGFEKGRTYLGIYIGDMALSVGVRFNEASRTGHVSWSFHNPAIFVPDLGRIVVGAESWWGVIKSPEDLRKITDLDIESVWYVQAIKSLDGDKPAATG